MSVVTEQNVRLGMKVKRGPDWKWGEQDRNGEGKVIAFNVGSGHFESEDLGKPLADPLWCRIRWDLGGENGYRIGCDGRFDLSVADCESHEWISVLDCQYPFRTCRLCKEIETLEQEAV